MKKASKIMYIIGKVCNIIEIVVSSLGIVGGILMLIFAPQIAQVGIEQSIEFLDTAEKVKASGLEVVITTILTLTFAIVVLIFANKAIKSIGKDEKVEKPHIIMLILGIFNNVFHFLGGLFGLLYVTRKIEDKKETETE